MWKPKLTLRDPHTGIEGSFEITVEKQQKVGIVNRGLMSMNDCLVINGIVRNEETGNLDAERTTFFHR